MVRTVWVGVAFVCGSLLGVLATRAFTDRPAAMTETSGAEARVASAAMPALPATSAQAAPVHVPEGAPGHRQNSNAPGVAAAPPAAAGMQTPDNSVAEDPAARHIDVGVAFHQVINRPSDPEFPNDMGDAHRTLERETRDYSWADSIESEIRNSLMADVSVGDLKVEFLECRATICELRLSADAKSDAMNQWSANSGSYPWFSRLQSLGMAMSSSSEDTRSQGIWLFRKPAKPPR